MDQDGILLKNITLKNTETVAELSGLQPGTRYSVTVVTEAVSLQTFVSTQAVTGTYYGMFLSSAAFSLFWVIFCLKKLDHEAPELRPDFDVSDVKKEKNVCAQIKTNKSNMDQVCC